MRYFFVLSLALAACSEIEPPGPTTGTLSGTITGTNIGALAGVIVTVQPNGSDALTVVTTSNGGYSFSAVPTGAGTITLAGYPGTCSQPATANYTVDANATNVVNISLSCSVQVQTGTVTGTVTSSLGGPIANAQVSLTPSGGSALPAVTTNANGAYAITAVPAGNGSVAIAGVPANCTAPAAQTYSALAGGGSATVNFTVTCTPQNAAEGFLVYNGTTSYAEIPSASQLSVSSSGLTIAVWMRPDVLTFPKTSGSEAIEQYVHWLGKGDQSGPTGNQEWTFRMYSQVPGDDRGNRISFYVFSPDGGYGCGSYFQDSITPGQWIHVVGVVDANAQTTAIYKNGVFRHSDSYVGGTVTITPTPGSAPMRFGSKDMSNFFEGAIGPVRVWNRPLSASEVQALYASNTVPPNGLVAAYALTEGQGSTIVDSVAANNGMLFNTTWGQGARQPVANGTGTSGGGC
jgi:hypothetical protein